VKAGTDGAVNSLRRSAEPVNTAAVTFKLSIDEEKCVVVRPKLDSNFLALVQSERVPPMYPTESMVIAMVALGEESFPVGTGQRQRVVPLRQLDGHAVATVCRRATLRMRVMSSAVG
jgi:hypothetical protein